jgi:serine/threonine protein kinase
MSYCFNPRCQNPDNLDRTDICLTCQAPLMLGDRYLATRIIGQGNFGRTFLAIDRHHANSACCVIKQFFPQDLGTHKKAEALFQQEATRLEELGQHQQIPNLIEALEQDGWLYLVQEWIDGKNLAQELAEIGRFDETQIRQSLLSLLPVLKFVHEQKIVHRDIKPENIIRQAGDRQLYLVDFGAAKLMTGTALLKTGTLIGSAAYIAPEQLMGQAVFASDLYSLGVTCIHLLTQTEPFNCYSIAQGTWVWRDYLDTPVSQKLGAILDKLLERSLSRRYHSAAAVLRDLRSTSNTTKATSNQSIVRDFSLKRSQASSVTLLRQDLNGLTKHLKTSAAVAILMAAGAAFRHTPDAYQAEVYFKHHALSTVGIVQYTTSQRSCYGGMGFGYSCSTTYTATIQFKDTHGKNIVFSNSSICSQDCKNKLVPVLYDPNHLSSARVGTEINPRNVARGWLIFALVLFSGGIRLLIVSMEQNRQAP